MLMHVPPAAHAKTERCWVPRGLGALVPSSHHLRAHFLEQPTKENLIDLVSQERLPVGVCVKLGDQAE